MEKNSDDEDDDDDDEPKIVKVIPPDRFIFRKKISSDLY